jgi:hypothetical protein
MLTTLLFIAVIISFKTFTKGFTKLNSFSRKLKTRLLNPPLISFSKTKLNVRITSTTFYDDDNDENKEKLNKKYNYNYEYYSDCVSDSDFNLNNHIREEIILSNNEKVDSEAVYNFETLYTLIWFDCENCRQLLNDIKNECKKIVYIDGSYYFFDENDETNTPLFYKNDELIATDLFTIYEELFYNKKIETKKYS